MTLRLILAALSMLSAHPPPVKPEIVYDCGQMAVALSVTVAGQRSTCRSAME